MKYSKEVLELCIKKVGIKNGKLIREYFNINYNGQFTEDNKDDKPSKELYAFFNIIEYFLPPNRYVKTFEFRKIPKKS